MVVELKIAVLIKHMGDKIFQLESMKYSIYKALETGLERCQNPSLVLRHWRHSLSCSACRWHVLLAGGKETLSLVVVVMDSRDLC